MNLKPFLWFSGLYTIKLDKNCNRFLSYCNNNGIKLEKADFNSEDESITVTLSGKSFRYVLAFFEKTETRYSIISAKGLIPLIKRYHDRYFFVAGLILFVFFIAWSSRYICNIMIYGTKYYSEEQLICFVKENISDTGGLRSRIDCNAVEEDIREAFPGISWVSCYLEGNVLCVNVCEILSETQYKELNEINKDLPQNIICINDALITDIFIYCGKTMVSLGDEVKKGDVIISGETEIYNEFGEVIDTGRVHADGIVKGQVEHRYYDEIPMVINEKVYQDNRKYLTVSYKDCSIKLFAPFYSIKEKDEHYDTYFEELNFPVFETAGISFPFEIGIVCESPYEIKGRTYSKNEVKNIAEKRLKKYIDDMSKKGVEIVQNNVKIAFRENKCIAEGTIVTRELIGIPELIE